MSDLPKFTEAVLGPDDFLVLLPHDALSWSDLTAISESLPDRLKDRVLVVERMDLFIGRPVTP